MDVERKHPKETGDSEVVSCPKCGGTKLDPQYGSECPTCLGTGWIYQQRFDPSGKAIRVNLVDAAPAPAPAASRSRG